MEISTYKILIIGEKNIGKTFFVNKFFGDSPIDCGKTIGFNLNEKIIKIKNKKLKKFIIWDCSPLNMNTISYSFYRGVHGLILFYDVTNLKSFELVKSWSYSIKDENPKNIVVYIVGNKIDLESERKVAKENGEKLGFFFAETSAKIGNNVNEIFEDISEKIDKVREVEKLDEKKLRINESNREQKVKIGSNFPDEIYEKFPELMKYIDF